MNQCELCGRESEGLARVKIEGAIVQACEKCSSLGTAIYTPTGVHTGKTVQPSYQRDINKDPELREDFSKVLQQEQQKRKMNQQEFSQFLQIKENELKRLQSGKLIPTEQMVQKLEKKLNVSFYENK